MPEDHPNTDRISRTNAAQMKSQAEKRAGWHRAPDCGLCSHYRPAWLCPVVGTCSIRSRSVDIYRSPEPPPEPTGHPCSSFHEHRPDELIRKLLFVARCYLGTSNRATSLLCHRIVELLLKSRPHDLREHGPDHSAEGSWWCLYYETKEQIVNLFQCMKPEIPNVPNSSK